MKQVVVCICWWQSHRIEISEVEGHMLINCPIYDGNRVILEKIGITMG